jgi:hypothetical protein
MVYVIISILDPKIDKCNLLTLPSKNYTITVTSLTKSELLWRCLHIHFFFRKLIAEIQILNVSLILKSIIYPLCISRLFKMNISLMESIIILQNSIY